MTMCRGTSRPATTRVSSTQARSMTAVRVVSSASMVRLMASTVNFPVAFRYKAVSGPAM